VGFSLVGFFPPLGQAQRLTPLLAKPEVGLITGELRARTT
jgi:hypothetical protein